MAKNLRKIEQKTLFLLLVLTNFFVGGMVGLERTVLPLIAEAEFGLSSAFFGVSFIATFGLSKAITNFFAGRLADKYGRKIILIIGWLLAIPIPFILISSDSWLSILFANVLLGVQQSLTWSMTVVMKVDIVKPNQRGFAIGLNEFAGYSGLSFIAYLTGIIASHTAYRPEPFYVGFVLILLGLLCSFFSKETRPKQFSTSSYKLSQVFMLTSWKHKTMHAISLAGLFTNFKDGMLWGLLPLLLAERQFSLNHISLIVFLYPIVWSISQLKFGPLSDRVGRRKIILYGLFLQSISLFLFSEVEHLYSAIIAAVLVGLGTGMVYPTLIAFISDCANANIRAGALGIYRFWRDLGYAVGALSSGYSASLIGIERTLTVVGFVFLAVTLYSVIKMKENLVETKHVY